MDPSKTKRAKVPKSQGHKRVLGNLSLLERFNHGVDWTKGECWNWKKCRNRDGYGHIHVSGKGPQLAHRVSWELHRGRIPEGLGVLHSCDNPSCVRPGHLFLGTPADNDRDKRAKGRARTLSGEVHPSAKLTEDQVRAIRRLMGKRTGQQLAEQFGVSQVNISKIFRGHTWKSVEV